MIAGMLILFGLVPAAVVAGRYLFGAAFGRNAKPVSVNGPKRMLAVLIPAHNEAASLPYTLASIRAADYSADKLTVLVVADHCTDATADVARESGARVAIRCGSRDRGKGYALAFGFEYLQTVAWDAVVILDADCTLAADGFIQMNAALDRGAEAVQAALVSAFRAAEPTSVVAAVGSFLDRRHAIALDRFGLSVPLRGTGMCFGAALLGRIPWSATGLAEDAEYGSALSRAGVRVHPIDAVVECSAPAREADFLNQRRRWRESLRVGGHSWLNSKPLGLLQLMLTGVAIGALAPRLEFLIPFSILVGITGAVYVEGMARVGVRRFPAGGLRLVARLAWVAIRGIWWREGRWQRAAR